MIAGNLPVVPTRSALSVTNRPAAASTIPRGGAQQRFFSQARPAPAPQSFDRRSRRCGSRLQRNGAGQASHSQRRQRNCQAHAGSSDSIQRRLQQSFGRAGRADGKVCDVQRWMAPVFRYKFGTAQWRNESSFRRVARGNIEPRGGVQQCAAAGKFVESKWFEQRWELAALYAPAEHWPS